MLGNEPQNKSLVTVQLDLVFDILLVRSKLAAQPCGYVSDGVNVVDNFHISEHYHAPYLHRPFTAVACTSVMYAERDLGVALQCIKSVSRSATMKIYSAVGLVVEMIHRHAVRVSAVAVYSQNTASLGFENPYALIK